MSCFTPRAILSWAGRAAASGSAGGRLHHRDDFRNLTFANEARLCEDYGDSSQDRADLLDHVAQRGNRHEPVFFENYRLYHQLIATGRRGRCETSSKLALQLTRL